VGDPKTDYGPSMTSMLDYTDEHCFLLADGGLPSNFGGLLEIVRALDGAGHGWRGLLLRAKRLAARVGLSDQPITHRHLRPQSLRPIKDSLGGWSCSRPTKTRYMSSGVARTGVR
jgi:hypothetical protein